jgi:hypothetical protein
VLAVAGDDQVGPALDGALEDAVVGVLGSDDGERDRRNNNIGMDRISASVAEAVVGSIRNLVPVRVRPTCWISSSDTTDVTVPSLAARIARAGTDPG